jgi:hypothetical protein
LPVLVTRGSASQQVDSSPRPPLGLGATPTAVSVDLSRGDRLLLAAGPVDAAAVESFCRSDLAAAVEQLAEVAQTALLAGEFVD